VYFSELINMRIAVISLVTVLIVGAGVEVGLLFVVEVVTAGCGWLSSSGLGVGSFLPAPMAGCGKRSNATSSTPKVLVNISQILYIILALTTPIDVIFIGSSANKTY
jgi:hypothetical protein